MRSECTRVFVAEEEEELFPILRSVAENNGFLIRDRLHVNLGIVVHVHNLFNELSTWHVFSAVLVFYVDVELKSLS